MQSDVVSKNAANIYPSNKYDFFTRLFIIDHSQNTLQLKYSVELPPTV